jgi:hypothetical protein
MTQEQAARLHEAHEDERARYGRDKRAQEQREALEAERDWFRLRWALAQGCTVEAAQDAYERDRATEVAA